MPSIELVTKYGILGLLETLTIPISCDFKSNFVSSEGDLSNSFSIYRVPDTSRTIDRTRYDISGAQPCRTPNRRYSPIAVVSSRCELRIVIHPTHKYHILMLIKEFVSNKQENEAFFL